MEKQEIIAIQILVVTIQVVMTDADDNIASANPGAYPDQNQNA
jgi:hypothetical protein